MYFNAYKASALNGQEAQIFREKRTVGADFKRHSHNVRGCPPFDPEAANLHSTPSFVSSVLKI